MKQAKTVYNTVVRKLLGEEKSVNLEEWVQLINDSEIPQEQLIILVVALVAKPLEEAEIAKLVQILKSKVKIGACKEHQRVIDVCGTGGDGNHTFNISTAVAVVLASIGIPVVKHGNRSISSHCGSADLLESLGINIEIKEAQIKESLDRHKIAFLYAPEFYPSLKRIGQIRRMIGVRTFWNLIGPILNPYPLQYQNIGVYSWEAAQLVSRLCRHMGYRRYMVFHSKDGWDEVSPFEETQIIQYDQHQGVKEWVLDPKQYFKSSEEERSLVTVQSLEQAKKLFLEVLSGENIHHIASKAVILNTALALITVEYTESMEQAIDRVQKELVSGRVQQQFKKWQEI